MTHPTTLTRRQLNRALLARQHLAERGPLSPTEMTAHLLALQAQVASPPYFGLWTRLQSFTQQDLTELMEAKAVVRTAALRSTLHLMTRDDFCELWSAIQPALVKGLRAFHGKVVKAINISPLLDAARDALLEEPLTFRELGEKLAHFAPEQDVRGLAYIARSYIPLVQVPPAGTWGTGGRPRYALAEEYLGQTVSPSDDLQPLFYRYLAAFGPASIMDFQAWTGLTNTRRQIDTFKDRLLVFQDEAGRDLFDLPGQPLPPEDTPAPVRYIPGYDNLVLAHADRTRILPDEHRKQVLRPAGVVAASVLLDGLVAGNWKIDQKKTRATLNVAPFRPLSAAEKEALEDEGLRLLAFAAEDSDAYAVEFETAD